MGELRIDRDVDGNVPFAFDFTPAAVAVLVERYQLAFGDEPQPAQIVEMVRGVVNEIEFGFRGEPVRSVHTFHSQFDINAMGARTVAGALLDGEPDEARLSGRRGTLKLRCVPDMRRCDVLLVFNVVPARAETNRKERSKANRASSVGHGWMVPAPCPADRSTK